MIVTLPMLMKARRKARPLSVQFELAALIAGYHEEVCTTIKPWPESRPLSVWAAFFKLRPDLYTPSRRARIAYARDTKVEFSVSAELAKLLGPR